MTFAVRSSRAGTQAFLTEIQQAVSSINAVLPVAAPRTMQGIYSKSLARTSFTPVMLGIAGAMALALSIIGIYGVISYAVSHRTREIGIRLALGSQKSELRWMFVRYALTLTWVGIAIGLGAAATAAQLMRNLLFGISPLDPLSFAAVALVLAVAAALASYVPTSRAVAVNPVDALKAECSRRSGRSGGTGAQLRRLASNQRKPPSLQALFPSEIDETFGKLRRGVF